jgi:hypothetical protein
MFVTCVAGCLVWKLVVICVGVRASVFGSIAQVIESVYDNNKFFFASIKYYVFLLTK